VREGCGKKKIWGVKERRYAGEGEGGGKGRESDGSRDGGVRDT